MSTTDNNTLMPPEDDPGAMSSVDDSKMQWTERYRPQVAKDLILPTYVREHLGKILTGELKNCILCGPAGVGKSSIGRVIQQSHRIECMWIDGAKGRGIETLQGDMTSFATTSTVKDFKLIVLDEADQYTPQALNSLRGVWMESQAEFCGLVLTCNDVTKIPPAVRARTVVLDFSNFTPADLEAMKREFLVRISWITRREKATFVAGTVDYVVDKHFPDMRTILRTLQTLPRETTPEELLGRDIQAEANQSSMPKHRVRHIASPPLAPDTIVDGADLLKRIAAVVAERALLPPGGKEIVALFAAHTHLIAAASYSPILALTSVEKGSGKSTVLQMLRRLVRDPLYVSNATAAGVFRELEKWSPTLIADEGDNYLERDANWNSLLHGGFARGGGHILRAHGKDAIIYDPWGPKAIGKIGGLGTIVASRSIILPMKPMTPEESRVRKKLLGTDDPLFMRLKAELEFFAEKNVEALHDLQPDLPVELHNRNGDVWLSYIAIADLVGGAWPKKVRDIAIAYVRSRAKFEQSPLILLLTDIRRIFDETGADRLYTEELTELLAGIEGRPWALWPNDVKKRGEQLGRLLMPLGIQSRQFRKDGKNLRGYWRKQFEDDFLRYLPAPKAA